MDIYSFGDDSFDDISDDEDMNPFAVGYIKECERAKNVTEEASVDDEDMVIAPIVARKASHSDMEEEAAMEYEQPRRKGQRSAKAPAVKRSKK